MSPNMKQYVFIPPDEVVYFFRVMQNLDWSNIPATFAKYALKLFGAIVPLENMEQRIRNAITIGNPIVVQKERTWTDLMQYCKSGNIDAVRVLLKHPFPVLQLFARDAYNSIPLMAACIHGYTEVVELLLEHNPSGQVLTQDDFGFTPMMYACFFGHASVLKVLSKHNMFEQFLMRTPNGQNAMAFACYRQQHSCIRTMFELLAPYVPASYNASVPAAPVPTSAHVPAVPVPASAPVPAAHATPTKTEPDAWETRPIKRERIH